VRNEGRFHCAYKREFGISGCQQKFAPLSEAQVMSGSGDQKARDYIPCPLSKECKTGICSYLNLLRHVDRDHRIPSNSLYEKDKQDPAGSLICLGSGVVGHSHRALVNCMVNSSNLALAPSMKSTSKILRFSSNGRSTYQSYRAQIHSHGNHRASSYSSLILAFITQQTSE
jgi:hypothetical protein